jgi:hypothetical protein
LPWDHRLPLADWQCSKSHANSAALRINSDLVTYYLDVGTLACSAVDLPHPSGELLCYGALTSTPEKPIR